jgi:hypothetical protein
MHLWNTKETIAAGIVMAATAGTVAGQPDHRGAGRLVSGEFGAAAEHPLKHSNVMGCEPPRETSIGR